MWHILKTKGRSACFFTLHHSSALFLQMLQFQQFWKHPLKPTKHWFNCLHTEEINSKCKKKKRRKEGRKEDFIKIFEDFINRITSFIQALSKQQELPVISRNFCLSPRSCPQIACAHWGIFWSCDLWHCTVVEKHQEQRGGWWKQQWDKGEKRFFGEKSCFRQDDKGS